MSGRPREMPESFGELSAPGAEAKPGFAALEEENSLLRPLSPPPPRRLSLGSPQRGPGGRGAALGAAAASPSCSAAVPRPVLA